MKYAPIPKDEEIRLCSVYNLNILDTQSDSRFDKLTKEATKVFQVPISTVSILDKDREWYKSKQGLENEEGERNISFCAHALLQQEIMIVEDTLLDPRFVDNPYVINSPYIRFYAGKSLYDKRSGQPVGVFCIKDYSPRKMSMNDINLFLNLAEKAENLLNQS